MTLSAIHQKPLEILAQDYLEATVEQFGHSDEEAVFSILKEVKRRGDEERFNRVLRLFNHSNPRYGLDRIARLTGVSDLARAIYLDELGWTEESRAEEIWRGGKEYFGDSDPAYRMQGVVNNVASIGEAFVEYPVISTAAALLVGAPLAVGIALEVPAVVIAGAVLVGATALYGVAGAVVHEIKAALSESREERVKHLLEAGNSMGYVVQSLPIGTGIVRSVEKSSSLLVEASHSVSTLGVVRNAFKTRNALQEFEVTHAHLPIASEELQVKANPVPSYTMDIRNGGEAAKAEPLSVEIPDGSTKSGVPALVLKNFSPLEPLPTHWQIHPNENIHNALTWLILPAREDLRVRGFLSTFKAKDISSEEIAPEVAALCSKWPIQETIELLEELYVKHAPVDLLIGIFARILHSLEREDAIRLVMDLSQRGVMPIEIMGEALAQVPPAFLATVYPLFFQAVKNSEQEKVFVELMAATLAAMSVSVRESLFVILQFRGMIDKIPFASIIAETLARLPVAEGAQVAEQLADAAISPAVFDQALHYLGAGENAALHAAVRAGIDSGTDLSPLATIEQEDFTINLE